MTRVKAVVSVAIEFDAPSEITEKVIEQKVYGAFHDASAKVNDVVVERWITYSNDERSVERV